MKKIISFSIFLLLAGAIYGIIEYKVQQKKGALKQLYKDETYNAKPEKVSAPKEKKQKELAAEDFSRAAIVEEELPSPKPRKVNNRKADATTDKDLTAKPVERKDKFYGSKTRVEKAAVVESQPEIIIAEEPEQKDSIQSTVTEKKEVRLAEFSRAPIRKKVVRKNADETTKTDSVVKQ